VWIATLIIWRSFDPGLNNEERADTLLRILGPSTATAPASVRRRNAGR
jgi:hypothetical protein